jgi:hypothetical protein
MNVGYRIGWLLGLSLFLGMAQADVYKYVDGLGRIHYTDHPKHSGYELVIKSDPARADPVPTRPDRPVTSVVWPSLAGSQWRTHPTHRQQYEPAIRLAARKYHLDTALLHAVVRAESAYNPSALSPKGAIGLMQLMPDTAARYRVNDPYNPVQNIEGGAHYLSDLINLFGSDVRLAVAAYNAGENNVIKYGNRIPPFAETRDYVNRVLQYYQQLN